MATHAFSNDALDRLQAVVKGTARVDTRTKRLALRIHPGEIAIIHHKDLDLPCAQALISRRVVAVVNGDTSISGRFPNAGPEALLAAGIPLLDNVGAEVMTILGDGAQVEIRGDVLWHDSKPIARGERMTPEILCEKMVKAKANLGGQLSLFVQNTLSFVSREQQLLYDPSVLPDLRTRFTNRHVLIVVRGQDAAADLQTIRSYVRERKPVLVGVDGGADLLLAHDLVPDIIIGDMDSVSDEALRCGAELVVQAYSDRRAPGLTRLEKMGLEAKVFASLGTSEDVAMLLAYEKGAELIIAVGAHTTLLDFLEKSRAGMSSTFLVRLKVGEILVDAKGLSKLYPTPLPIGYLLAMAALALAAVIILATFAPQVRSALEMVLLRIRSLF
jgi:uncharacterized membrane-anchored protein